MNVGLETTINVPPVEVVRTAEVKEQVIPQKLQILNMNINFGPNGKAIVFVRWNWVDGEGNIVKSGVTRKTENELASLGLDVSALKTLFANVAKADAEGATQTNNEGDGTSGD